MTEQRLTELRDLSHREKRLRDLKKHFDGIALKKQASDIVKFIEREDEYRMESVFQAANHISLGSWVRIAAIINNEWENARDEFSKAV